MIIVNDMSFLLSNLVYPQDNRYNQQATFNHLKYPQNNKLQALLLLNILDPDKINISKYKYD